MHINQSAFGDATLRIFTISRNRTRMRFTNYKMFANFDISPYSIAERGIKIYDITKTVILVAISFAEFKNIIEFLIHNFLKIDNKIREILTSKLSVKYKVPLITSIMRKKKIVIPNNADVRCLKTLLDEFGKFLYKCKKLRRQLIHSFYFDYGNKGATRVKITSNSKRLNKKEGFIERSYSINVNDFIVSVKM